MVLKKNKQKKPNPNTKLRQKTQPKKNPRNHSNKKNKLQNLTHTHTNPKISKAIKNNNNKKKI